MDSVSEVKGLLLSLALVGVILVEPVMGVGHRRLAAEQSENEHLVTELPGQPPVNFKHYAGHVTVNEENGRALFYWFFEATTQPELKPLVLWLNGGPGCSSVGLGATQEIGPFLLDKDGLGLKYNPFSWNRDANLLFLESPIGVGFSYSNTITDYEILGDDLTATDAYAFLHEWFIKFPLYRTRPLYIAGESYAGKYIPELAELIIDKNMNPFLHIDLRGIMMGNPQISDIEDWIGMVDYAWSHAVISDETYELIKQSCNFSRNDTWYDHNCILAVEQMLSQYEKINIYSIYTPKCPSKNKYPQFKFTPSMMMSTMMAGYDPCLSEHAKVFYNRANIQKALHVSDGYQVKEWILCNNTVFDMWSNAKPTVLPIYKKLIAAGIRIWLYSGDTDGRVPVLSTRYSIRFLKLPIVKPWRPWYHQNQVSGWYQEYMGLTLATFKGAGHDVPTFKRKESLEFFLAFLHGASPPQLMENRKW